MTRKDVSIIFLIPMTLVLSIQYFKQKLTEWGARRQTGGNCVNFCCNSSAWWALQSHEMLSRQNVIYAGMNKGLYCKLQNFRTISCKVISPRSTTLKWIAKPLRMENIVKRGQWFHGRNLDEYRKSVLRTFLLSCIHSLRRPSYCIKRGWGYFCENHCNGIFMFCVSNKFTHRLLYDPLAFHAILRAYSSINQLITGTDSMC